MKKKIRISLSFIATIGFILLSVIFLYYNPYSEASINYETIIIVFTIIVLPVCLTFLFVILSNKMLTFIFLIISLPGSLYLGLSAIPSIWNLFILALIIQIFSVLLQPK
ncbi:hypothetical protein HPT25_27250 [Bacillus sp. BRMEA1]|uniref:hypothetical protein n=1 Tax=Neobacillus endophyticus TaxID=2738405 RepID=UPI001565BDBD|nr:hypothetical protein [Neobacillus endophyticus]NRD81020.1 hypothetical protein [Neobacillus endophyticus]